MSGTQAITLNRTERWFVRAALPQLVAEFTARPQVVPRMVPFLTGASLYWLLQVASVPTILSLILPLLLMAVIWPVTGGLNGHRPPRLSWAGVVGVAVFHGAVFVVGGPLVHAAWPGAFGPDATSPLVVGTAGWPRRVGVLRWPVSTSRRPPHCGRWSRGKSSTCWCC
ncbi:hypothetical protein M1L60_26260 [Actinoplanes sp. TRM 88003]|uniref:Uncharacterized protein n=1 Tax=Paractinoplanes aksuensis TaxID=2939490 RepID=A0ABT1DTE5_9ACTN|nr:hypothetical protein [Actinoplanes aksuensis]MCO8274109.1 hypothetical protein [Actinoplanes aksuensis]